MAYEVQVEHLSGSKQGQTESFPADQPITVGRDPSCTLSFDPAEDLDVSAQHAQIAMPQPGQFQLTDAGSSNGTYVNGQKVQPGQPVPLQPGSLVEFGVPGSAPKVRLGFQEIPETTEVEPPAEEEEEGLEEAEEEESSNKLTCCVLPLLLVVCLGSGLLGYWFCYRNPALAARQAAVDAREEAERSRDAARATAREGEVSPDVSSAWSRGSEKLEEGTASLEEGAPVEAREAFETADQAFQEAGAEIVDVATARVHALEARQLMEAARRRVEAIGWPRVREVAEEALQSAVDQEGRAVARLEEGDFERATDLFDQARDRYDQVADQGVIALRIEEEQAASRAARAAAERAAEETERLQAEIDELTEQAAEDEEARRRLELLERARSEDRRLYDLYGSRRNVACIVHVRSYLVSREDPSRRSPLGEAIGTGTVVGRSLIATAKSLIQPWKFDAEALARVERARESLDMDVETRVRVRIASLGDEPAADGFEQVHDTRQNTLEVAFLADDVPLGTREVTIMFDGEEQVVEVTPHRDVLGNLALLRVQGDLGIEPLPLLDPIEHAGHRSMTLQVAPGGGRITRGDARLDRTHGTVSFERSRVVVEAPIVPLGVGGPVCGLGGTEEEPTLGLLGITCTGRGPEATEGGRIEAIPASVIRDALDQVGQ